MNDDSFNTDLQRRMGELKRERKPQRDLWPGIEQALTEQNTPTNRNFKYRKLSAVAASLAVVFCSLIFWQYHQADLQQSALIAEIKANHTQQLNFLYSSFEDQTALTKNWQEQIAELDKMAQEVLKALKNDPNNMDLIQMLKSIYQQKLLLVERVHQPKWQHVYNNREVAL